MRASHRLVKVGPFEVFLASAAHIPWCLREIGRLREVTFRDVGEGTGRQIDLDQYDDHHLHLFAWHAEFGEIAGAYRLTGVDPTMGQRGLEGLYNHSLFEIDPEFFERVGPATELGRSFVRTTYQRHNSSLLALWRGLATAVAESGRRNLFGAVSISNDFSPASRDLMVAYLRTHAWDAELSAFVQPRTPYTGAAVEPPSTFAELCERVEAIEGRQRPVPILLRQYLKLGARVVGFNVDPGFSSVVDALMILDLDGAETPLLRRILKPENP
jgi:putative hemolysin